MSAKECPEYAETLVAIAHDFLESAMDLMSTAASRAVEKTSFNRSIVINLYYAVELATKAALCKSCLVTRKDIVKENKYETDYERVIRPALERVKQKLEEVRAAVSDEIGKLLESLEDKKGPRRDAWTIMKAVIETLSCQRELAHWLDRGEKLAAALAKRATERTSMIEEWAVRMGLSSYASYCEFSATAPPLAMPADAQQSRPLQLLLTWQKVETLARYLLCLAPWYLLLERVYPAISEEIEHVAGDMPILRWSTALIDTMHSLLKRAREFDGMCAIFAQPAA